MPVLLRYLHGIAFIQRSLQSQSPLLTYPESKFDTFALALFIEDGKWIAGQAEVPASEKHALAEGFKAMQTEGDALKDLDFVIEPFAGTVALQERLVTKAVECRWHKGFLQIRRPRPPKTGTANTSRGRC